MKETIEKNAVNENKADNMNNNNGIKTMEDSIKTIDSRAIKTNMKRNKANSGYLAKFDMIYDGRQRTVATGQYISEMAHMSPMDFMKWRVKENLEPLAKLGPDCYLYDYSDVLDMLMLSGRM